MPERILVIDGLNVFIRTWTVVPIMNNDGEHVGGTIGFIRTMKNMIRETKPTKVVICWDGQGGSARRRGIYAGYKEGRKPRVNREYEFDETPNQSKQNLKSQYLKTKQYCEMLGVYQVEVDDCEADDVVAYVCKFMYADIQKVIVSSDKDFYQLIDRKTIIYSPSKKIYLTAPAVTESFGVSPENFIYAKAISGDRSDNIKGIKGIGFKTIVKLFPFLSEKESSVDEIMAYASANEKKNPKYKSILDSRELIIASVGLMQLSSPIISPSSIRAIRYALEPDKSTFKMSDFKLALIRDGVQIVDVDFFPTFGEFKARSQQPQGEPKNE